MTIIVPYDSVSGTDSLSKQTAESKETVLVIVTKECSYIILFYIRLTLLNINVTIISCIEYYYNILDH